ncbi:LOW QUALITY PROTEIN: uncharacterized protein [Erythrolamprus reginae]|uniref:LOW QUALITY PROTEIN: uncharacterized protein n=1 Tax=Erythrolamprus reginae TaxID=121349 RepID=UPI00396CB1A8
MAQQHLIPLFLLSYFTGALAQFTLTQPPSLSVSPGGTVRITCTRAGGSISSYNVGWYQQTPGTKPVLVIHSFSSRPSGIPERFSGSYDSSANSATLSISNVQPEDEADYYCSSYNSNSQSTVIQPYGELGQKPKGVSASLECFTQHWLQLNLRGRRRGPPRRNFAFRRSVLAHFSAMAQRFLFLLFLLTYFTGALAQFTMTQPPSLSVSLGGTVRITCTRAGGSISSYYVSWYQQNTGTKPLTVIYQDTSRPSGIPERFSGSVDPSSNSATLSISNVQPEDEADYYCSSYHGNYQPTDSTLWGTGTKTIRCLSLP